MKELVSRVFLRWGLLATAASLLLAGPATAQELYGAYFDAGQFELRSIDPVTGAMVTVLPTGVPAVAVGVSAFDPVGKRFFFRSDDDLHVANLRTGTVSTAPNEATIYAYDPGPEILYALDFESGQVWLFSVDTTTGVRTPLVATGAATLALGTSALDTDRQLFYFHSGTELYTIDIAGGTVSHVVSEGALYEVDPETGILYGLDFQSGLVELFTINPATGARNAFIGTGATALADSISAFDINNKRVFFFADDELYTIHIPTATVTSVLVQGTPLLEFDNGAPAVVAVPAMDKIGQLLLGIFLAGAAIWILAKS